ncbi:MAG: site-2 protease family protein, partial [Negativicutes bacterium]|nr:site-2 protease family protein [Negativicutes bacterium]
MAISFHEFAHAWVADKLGDHTARFAGRMTLDPRSHFDVFGFLLFIFAGFGWAKGVPYNSNNFNCNKRLGTILVSIAGVTANLLLAFISAVIYYGLLIFDLSLAIGPIGNLIEKIFIYNIVFMVFNLLPIPPLDGSKIVAALIPGDFEEVLNAVNPYGMFILIGLIYLGWIDKVMPRLIDGAMNGISG